MALLQRSLRLIAIYVLAALALTLISRALDARLKTETGLTESFYQGSLGDGDVLFQRTARSIGLDSVENDPDLPQRFFGMRWEGFWHVPHDEVLDIYAGGDDRVLVRIDGELVLERGGALGTNTISAPVPLDAGLHTLSVEYEQYRGGYSLHVLWAPAGGSPRPFDPKRST